MSTRHPAVLTLRLSLCVAATLALGACGDAGANRAEPGDPPSVATASDAPTTADETLAPPPSPSGSGPATPASSTPTPTSSPTAAPTSSTPAPTSSPRSTPTPPPSSGPRPPRLIGYAGGESPGVTVNKRADVKWLTGAPASFRRFIADTVERINDRSTCSGGAVGVTVQTLRTDGYAVGAVNDCGGYRALWAVVGGHWKEIAGTQDSWDCAILERYHVPSEVAGTTCYDYAGQQQHRYHQA